MSEERLGADAFAARYVAPFRGVQHMYDPARGWIVWRRGTGDNCELLHVRSFVPRMGHGRWLVRHMLRRLEVERARTPAENLPYPVNAVYGFTIVKNEAARSFYQALGFHLQRLVGLYLTGDAVLFWQDYHKLLETV